MLDEGFIVKQKRVVPKAGVCRKCGETFVFTDRTLREYCSTKCWYKRNLLADGTKACGVCKVAKPLSEFSKSKNSCKPCTTDRTIAYFEDLKRKSSISLLCLRSAANFCHGLGGQRAMREALEEKLSACLSSNGTCPYCNNVITLSTFSFDHIVPRSRGGAYNDGNNVHVTCLRCNSMKGNIGHEAFLSVRAFLAGMSEDERKIIEARLLSGNTRFTRKA